MSNKKETEIKTETKIEKEKETKREKKQTEVEFWGDNPNILFSTLEIFPLQRMSYSEQLNALTRMILCIGIILIIYYQSYHILLTFIATICFIYFIYSQKMKKEGFSENENENENKDNIIEIDKDLLPGVNENKKKQIRFQAFHNY